MNLPLWASTDQARALIASIVADPPAVSVRTSDWGSLDYYRGWKRPDIAALKRMHEDWLEAQFAALDAQWEVTGFWPEHQDNPLAVEQPDALIKRALAEAERADLEAKELPNGRFQVAA